MSHSTTATSIYVLGKYSKSYPTIQRSDVVQSIPQDGNTTDNASEWQHFTNPVIRLVLDVKRTGRTELESIRLRVLWSMNSGDVTSNVDQREVVFEDIDLFSLSCLPQPRLQKQQPQGLPLKAVYRDTVVGIRYLYSRHDVTPVYRRFQITFMSASAVLEFIDTIRTVCPCKANPTPAQARDITEPRPMPHPDYITATTIQAQNLHDPSAYIPPSLVAPPSLLPRAPHGHNHHAGPASSQYSALSISREEPRPSIYSSPLSLHGENPRLQPGVNSTSNVHPNALTQLQAMQKQTSFPSSSPPSSVTSIGNKNNLSMPPYPTNTCGSHVDPSSDAILASLKEVTALYDLPRETLEKVVGDVVREDGFIRLLENVSSMWRIKSFVGT